MSPSGQTRLRTTIETGDLAMRAKDCRAPAPRVSGTWMRLSSSSSGFPRAVTSSSAGRSSTLSITRTWDFRTRVGACLLAQMERRIPFAKAGVPLDRSRTLKPTREPCSSEQNSTSKLVLLCVEAGESCFRPFAGAQLSPGSVGHYRGYFLLSLRHLPNRGHKAHRWKRDLCLPLPLLSFSCLG
jgi:hypothetical protein